MAYLSKNIIRLNATDKKIDNKIIQLYNSKIYENIYVNKNQLDFFNFKKTKYFKTLQYLSNFNKIKKAEKIILGHGSFIKAEMFDDYDQFIPKTLLLAMLVYNDEVKIINKFLINQLLKTFLSSNKTKYFLQDKAKLQSFLNVNINKYSFLTFI